MGKGTASVGVAVWPEVEGKKSLPLGLHSAGGKEPGAESAAQLVFSVGLWDHQTPEHFPRAR